MRSRGLNHNLVVATARGAVLAGLLLLVAAGAPALVIAAESATESQPLPQAQACPQSQPQSPSLEVSDPRPEPPAEARLELTTVIEKAVTWLVENQHPDGGWGSHHSPRPIEVLASVPGSQRAFRVATSALCVMALEDCPIQTAASRRASSRGLDYLLQAYNVKRMSGLEHYNVWAFGYTLQCFGEWLPRHAEDERIEKVRAASRALIDKLTRYQSLDGGWGYLSVDTLQTYQPASTSMSFTTATILVGVARVQAAGIEVPEKLIDRAVASVVRSRMPSGSFAYGELWRMRPQSGINKIKGSACRTPSCQYALLLHGREVSADWRRKGLDDLLNAHIRFSKMGVRRPIPHESWYSISGYFYLYGMAYSAYILEGLTPKDHGRFEKPLFDAVMYCHQPDGSFWDYPLYSYHKPYGTAFALITLSRL